MKLDLFGFLEREARAGETGEGHEGGEGKEEGGWVAAGFMGGASARNRAGEAAVGVGGSRRRNNEEGGEVAQNTGITGEYLCLVLGGGATVIGDGGRFT